MLKMNSSKQPATGSMDSLKAKPATLQTTSRLPQSEIDSLRQQSKSDLKKLMPLVRGPKSMPAKTISAPETEAEAKELGALRLAKYKHQNEQLLKKR
jgi:hypothetical protein